MNARRLLEVSRDTLAHNLRRPLFWILLIMLALLAWQLATGSARIQTGDSDTGGAKAWMTSQFAMAKWLSVLVFLVYGFFVSVAAGMIVIHDDELKVGELLHSTPLTTREYAWGKWLGVVITFGVILALHLVFHAVSNHLLSGAEQAELVGPFAIANYVAPALIFGVPMIVFMAGASFALGTWTRKPIPVFFLPAGLLLFCLFFLWEWNPSWLQSDHPGIDQLLMCVDPSGLRWLNHTWIDVDRGVEFYNTASISVDPAFGASRLAMIVIGLLGVAFGERQLAATLRGRKPSRAKIAAPAVAADDLTVAAPTHRSLGELEMSARAPSLLRGLLEVARVELRELKSQPGLYLFVPLILLETISVALFRVGPFDTPVLSTSGTLAAESFDTLTLLVCLLLLFYTVESLERERSRGLASIYYATPVRSASILFGKSIANSVVGAVILLAAFAACVLTLVIQHKAPLELKPFVLLWGALLIPTFFAWCSFVTALYAVVRNRYTSYALALAVFAYTGYRLLQGEMNWAGNWNLWGVIAWSDIGPLELDRSALVLNRVLFIAIGIAFTALAVRLFPRRSSDPSSVLLRLRPLPLLRSTLLFSPYLIVPCLVLGVLLHDVNVGRGGDTREKAAKDYWRKNLATWRDVKYPSIVDVVVDLQLEPERSWFKSEGTYTLLNDLETPVKLLPVTPGAHCENLEWTLDGTKVEPQNRAGLRVFELDPPLARGAKLVLGFRFDGKLPDGISKNGGGMGEFILPSGVVLTSFSPSFVPNIGFNETIGIDKDNKYDAREYADDFYEGITRSGFGNNASSTTRITIHIPQSYTANSVGVKTSDEVVDGRRTVVWESDHPVEFFNVIAGKWDVRRGAGTAIYFHPEHTYNIDEMLEALDGARRWYSEWFYEYPWKELKLSEFAAHASYAQGFPTNISFAEGIGFLTKSDPRSRVAFIVAAHESAHQWWGNILTPGDGPGGNILSEGMSHFSTILLTEQVRGLRERIEFCKRLESKYGKDRQVDSERSLVKCDGARDGDTTVTYDKGGWVMWMLLNRMGRDKTLAGLHAFIAKYHNNPDHPVLQDLIATLREFAPDVASYDEFVDQWFKHVVVPEYTLEDAKREKLEDGDGWRVTALVKNKGEGQMPIEFAATRGVRFPEEKETSKRATDTEVQAAETGAPSEAYQETRTTVVLGPGESQLITLHCDFEPKQLLVDPDALVLQLRREKAIATF